MSSEGAGETFLVYPEDFDEPMDVELDHVRVRNMTFDLDEGLQENGEDFVEDLVDALSMPEFEI